jgi:hypothetical protein
MNEIKVIDDTLFFNCPHCSKEILVFLKDINCRIFRCGIFKDTFKQIDPHLPLHKCQQLIKENKIYGCAKPFEIIINNNKYFIRICDYI